MTTDPDVEIVARLIDELAFTPSKASNEIEAFDTNQYRKRQQPKAISKAASILAALREAGWSKDEWLPIESAPRPTAVNGDHPILLAYTDSRGRVVNEGYWDFEQWMTTYGDWCEPTHWRPLPDAPQTEAGGR